MPLRHDQVGYSPAEDRLIRQCAAEGKSKYEMAEVVNATIHGGRPVRSADAVGLRRGKIGAKVITPKQRRSTAPATPPAAEQEQSIETRDTETGTEARAHGRLIRTVDDLLRHIDADMTRFEIAQSEATKYEVTTKGPDGRPKVTEMFRVFVRLKPKAGPTALDLIPTLVAGVNAPRLRLPAIIARRSSRADVLQGLIIADPHVGRYAWDQETGEGDYDLSIAAESLRDAAATLIPYGQHFDVGRRAIWVLGDFFHYDTPSGTTTGGTMQDRDGRVHKMMRAGIQALCDIVDAAATVPTEVVLVPGNHDEVLTHALAFVLEAHFRNDRRVTVDLSPRHRKYREHGRCMIGLAHGDEARKRLPGLMAAEEPAMWGRTAYREIHHGHLHHEAESTTIDGVLVRQHRAVCPPDGWHYRKGFVRSPRGMQTVIYHADGEALGTRMWSPAIAKAA